MDIFNNGPVIKDVAAGNVASARRPKAGAFIACWKNVAGEKNNLYSSSKRGMKKYGILCTPPPLFQIWYNRKRDRDSAIKRLIRGKGVIIHWDYSHKKDHAKTILYPSHFFAVDCVSPCFYLKKPSDRKAIPLWTDLSGKDISYHDDHLQSVNHHKNHRTS